jgi:hypothetical protein
MSINFDTLSDDEWLDIDAVCRFFGGNANPLDPSTIYKGMRLGVYPLPVKAGPSAKPYAKGNRWSLGECREARRRRIEKSRAARELGPGAA